MIEDEELRGLPEPDEAQKAAAIAEFQAFEEEWWRERDAPSPGLASTSRPCRKRQGVIEWQRMTTKRKNLMERVASLPEELLDEVREKA